MLHWEPFFDDLKVQLCIGQSTVLQTFSKIGCATTSDIMQNGLGDKAAALSFSGHAVQNSQCFIWKDNIDAFAHTILGFKNLAYTHSVCMFTGFPAGSGRAECRRFLDTQSIQFQSVSIAFNQRLCNSFNHNQIEAMSLRRLGHTDCVDFQSLRGTSQFTITPFFRTGFSDVPAWQLHR